MARVFVVAAALMLGLPSIAVWHDGVPALLRVMAAAIAVLTVARPTLGLALAIGLAPIATPLGVIAEAPFSGAETLQALVLPALAALALRGAVRGTRPVARLFWPAVGLGAVLATTAGVQLAGLQEATAYPGAFLDGLGRFVVGPYLFRSRDYAPFGDALLWGQMLALAVGVEHVVRTRTEARVWLRRALALGVGTAAVAVAVRVIEVAARSPEPLAAAWQVVVVHRTSLHFADVNAAGSFYALIFVPMLWWAWRERSLLWMAAAGLIGPALWMTGSRAALVAAVGSVFVAWLLTERPHRRWIGIAILVTLPLAALAILNPARANVGVGLAFDVRRDMTVVAIELAAERPLFGLGFGGFRRESPAKATPAMLAVFPQLAAGENAHNNYLQVLVEFGLVGLLAVLVLLSRGFRRWPLVRDSPPDHVQSGLEAGLVAFCLTCLAGHPWLTPQVLVPFGAVLGLAAAGAGVASTRPRLPAAVAVLLALLAVSTPLRLRASSGDPSLGGVVVGGTEESADGPGWRRFDGRGRWFVPGDARVVIFAGQSVDATGPCAVTVRVDGEPVPAGVAWVGEQLRIRLALAPSTVAEHARRIDLRFGDGDCRVSMAPIEVRRLR